MGCCISAPKRHPDHKNAPNQHYSPPKSDKSHINNRPPPPSLEEETVKEVLSETPIIPKPQNKNTTPTIPTSTTIQEEKLEKMEDFINKEEEISEISQASEIYSNTESFSTTTTTTTTTTTIREDEAMSKQTRQVSHRVNRAPAKVPRKRPYSGDISGGRERGLKSQAGRGREVSGQVRSTQRNVGSSGIRRDLGEGSGPRSRSRSPATRMAGGVGRGGRAASQLKVTGTAGDRLMGGVDVEGKSDKEVNEGVLQQGNESLENPLVSLECFIFL